MPGARVWGDHTMGGGGGRLTRNTEAYIYIMCVRIHIVDMYVIFCVYADYNAKCINHPRIPIDIVLGFRAQVPRPR